MVKFYKISGLEKLSPFEKAITAAKNGTFGTVDDGEFAAGEDATHFVYEVEKGDAFACAYMDEAVEKRLCSLAKCVGHELIIAPEHIALGDDEELEVGAGLSSNSDGKLELVDEGGQLTITALASFDGEGVVAVVNAVEAEAEGGEGGEG